MLSGIHFILTYTCNFECDHCFLYCSPRTEGTFTLEQVQSVFKDLRNIPSIESICFEGGESFLFYPLLLASVQLASDQGYSVAIETNTYWATTEEDAMLWLEPLKKAGLSLLEVSDDAFHHGEETYTTAKKAKTAAEKLGLRVNTMCIDKPSVGINKKEEKGTPIYLGGPKLRGRAVDTLAKGLPAQPWKKFQECPFEDLRDPSRVHIDAYGNVHICQGISIGNFMEVPLSEIFKNYDPDAHPVCGPLLKGGPAELAKDHHVPHREEYVDACHLCTELCRALMDRYPEIIAPKQVYGVE